MKASLRSLSQVFLSSFFKLSLNYFIGPTEPTILRLVIIAADLLGSLTEVRVFSPPQCRNTAEERAGPFQQVWPPVNFMLACLKLADCDAETSRNMCMLHCKKRLKPDPDRLITMQFALCATVSR